MRVNFRFQRICMGGGRSWFAGHSLSYRRGNGEMGISRSHMFSWSAWLGGNFVHTWFSSSWKEMMSGVDV